MSDAVESGTEIAWRLLATLEGGSILLVTSALLAYTATYRVVRKRRIKKEIGTVLVTNTNTQLGKELKTRLESCGCTVSTVTSDATSGAESGPKVDALVVVGAEPKARDLNGISDLVTEDVYNNLKLLECLSSRVNRGGRIAWACTGKTEQASSGAFSDTSAAFDTVLQASLQHIAKVCHCETIWVGRGDGAERTAERIVAALMTNDSDPNTSTFTIRNAAIKVGEYLYKCLKTIT